MCDCSPVPVSGREILFAARGPVNVLPWSLLARFVETLNGMAPNAVCIGVGAAPLTVKHDSVTEMRSRFVSRIGY